MSDPEVEFPAALGRPQERAGEIVVRLGYLHVRAVANHRDDAAELTGLTTGAITGRVDRLEATGFARRTATARPAPGRGRTQRAPRWAMPSQSWARLWPTMIALQESHPLDQTALRDTAGECDSTS